MDGCRHALEGVPTKLVVGKVSPHQSEGGGANDDGIGRCESLETGRHIGRLPQGQLLLSPPATHLAYHHQAGMDAEAHGQLDTPLLLQASIEAPHRR